MALARILATEVLPMPLVPEKKYAGLISARITEFSKIFVMASEEIKSAKRCGRHLTARDVLMSLPG
jgi:hypothetical protein